VRSRLISRPFRPRGLMMPPPPRASAFGRSPGHRSLGPLGRFRVFQLLRRSRRLVAPQRGLLFSEAGRRSRETRRIGRRAAFFRAERASARRRRGPLPGREPAWSRRGLLQGRTGFGTAKAGPLPGREPAWSRRGLPRDLVGLCVAARACARAARPCFRPFRGTWFQVRRPDERVGLFFPKSPSLAEVLGTSPQSLENLRRRSRPGEKVSLFFPNSRDSRGSSREPGRSSRDFRRSPENFPHISRPGGRVGLFFPKSRDRGGKSRDLVSSTENLS
jgi:hypothetical protein